MLTLRELAESLSASFSGEGDRPINGLGTLASAGPAQLAFLANQKFLSQLAQTRAGAVIVHPDLAAECPVDCLLSETPYLTFARASQLFDDRPATEPGIAETATVSEHADVHPTASIGPGACVAGGAQVDAGAVIGANCFVGEDSRVGESTELRAGAVLYYNVHVGRDSLIHSNAVIGGDGFGFAPTGDGWEKIVQLGGVRIGDRVEIGACTTIDRGAIEHTVIEDGVIIDNQVQIAHNCRIGKNTAIAGCAGLAGSSIIGANCTIAGAVGIAGHLEICDNVHVTAMSLVSKSITEPGSYSSGVPLQASREWRRNAVRFTQLESIARRLKALEPK